MQVELVTRTGCHLCEEALAELRALGIEPRLRDVDGDAVLFAQFDFRVPVVLAVGRVVGEGRLDRAALLRSLGLPDVRITRCGPEAAEAVHRLTQAAFAGYSELDPPSGAGRESLDSVAADLARHGGALALVEEEPVGCLRMEVGTGDLHVRRLAVDPAVQNRGVGQALMRWAEMEARRQGFELMTAGVRLALPGNRDFFRRLGYEETERHTHPGYDHPTWVSLQKRL
jgi:GNAT superfamily N-acetyltransferase